MDGKVSQAFRPLDLSQRVSRGDSSVVADCIDTYGSFIWTLAKRFTQCESDAEALTQEVFDTIWPTASVALPGPRSEMAFIFGVVRSAVMARRTAALPRKPASVETSDTVIGSGPNCLKS